MFTSNKPHTYLPPFLFEILLGQYRVTPVCLNFLVIISRALKKETWTLDHAESKEGIYPSKVNVLSPLYSNVSHPLSPFIERLA